MDKELEDWNRLRDSLVTVADDQLLSLLDSCEVQYDGQYHINAGQSDYARLCQYYPLLETLVHEKLGKHLRLNLKHQSVPMGTDDDIYGDFALNMELGANSITEAILRPESIAAVPSYLLRFVPYVGANAVLIATALRQAFYRASRETGADQLYPKFGDSVKIDVRALLKSLGGAISRASFFRVFKNGDMDWFVRRGEPKHRVKDGQVQREANTYHYRGILLTPGDAFDLFDWLNQNDITTNPIATLSRLLDTQRDEVFSFPFRVPNPEKDFVFDEATSVHDVIERALSPQKLDPTLASLADRIANHLVRPESFLAVPWYWFHKVLPTLGTDLGMLYLMSKNCCYVDWAHGKDRNSFWVPGGLSNLQGWIRSETLPKQIPHAEPSLRGRPRQSNINADSAYTRNWRETKRQLASEYLCRIETRQSEIGTDWKLQVNDVQLTASDESMKQAIYGFIYAPPAQIKQLPMQELLQKPSFQHALVANAKAHPERLCHFETLVKEGICHYETLDAAPISHFDTFVDGLNYYFETLVEAGICQYETILNILFKLKYSSFFKQDTLNQPHTIDEADEQDFIYDDIIPEVVDHPLTELEWDYKSLFSVLDPKYQVQIRGLELEKIAVAWALQACFTLSINQPWSLAVRRSLETRKGPGGPAERMANLSMFKFKELIETTYYRIEGNYFNPLQLIMSGGQDLLDLLSTLNSVEDQKRALRRVRDTFNLYLEKD